MKNDMIMVELMKNEVINEHLEKYWDDSGVWLYRGVKLEQYPNGLYRVGWYFDENDYGSEDIEDFFDAHSFYNKMVDACNF